MKRKAVVTIIFVVVMIMLLQSSAFALIYSDVATTHWSYIPIDRVTDLNLMSGISSSMFGRNVELTRKEAAKIFTLAAQEMWRNEDEEFAYVGINTGFTDVPSSSAYAKYVAWVKSKGIMSGVSDTAFNPDVTITRQEICVSLYKLKQYLGTPFETVDYDFYADHDEISSWASGGVYAMTRFGVVTGDNYANFNPKDLIERQEMAAIMYSFWNLRRYKKNVITPVADEILTEIAVKEAEYNSATLTERANWLAEAQVERTAALACANVAEAMGYDVAADMLRHYINGTGEQYIFPLSEMIATSSSPQYDIYRDEVNDYRKAVETYIDSGNISIALRTEIYADEDDISGQNWILSVNKCRYASQITASQSSNAINGLAFYDLRDFYDYDAGGMGFFDIAATMLNRMNKLGLARCYHVIGSVDTGSWIIGARLY